MLSRSFFHLSCHLKRCDTVYYKLRQVLQSAMNLLQIATGITKCDDYYKLRQYIFPLVADKSGVNPEPNLLIMQSSWLCLGSYLPVRQGITFLATICTFCIIIIVVVVVVVVVYDETYFWVYLSSDYQFQVYYKVRQALLQSATEQTLAWKDLLCFVKTL